MKIVNFLHQHSLVLGLVGLVISCLSVMWLHPKVVAIAHKKGLTDNPDRRKLQHKPIPVLGGIVVFFGIAIGMGITSAGYDTSGQALVIALMILMLYTGTIDDIMGLTPRIRLLIEVVAALILIFCGGYEIDNLHGLWGIYGLSSWIGVPLTVIAVAGIINSINLIDGVDGLSSGYCMLACVIFGGWFYMTGDLSMFMICCTGIGALIPFFVHNVFGNKLKMFIGDGGTLMLGLMLSVFVLRTLGGVKTGMAAESGLIPFTLSVMAIPVFDTLRVMTQRIIRGVSPFYADRSHLHHAFISNGCSHISTTVIILLLAVATTAVWLLMYRAGIPADIQFYAVSVLGIMFTAGIYGVLSKRK